MLRLLASHASAASSAVIEDIKVSWRQDCDLEVISVLINPSFLSWRLAVSEGTSGLV